MIICGNAYFACCLCWFSATMDWHWGTSSLTLLIVFFTDAHTRRGSVPIGKLFYCATVIKLKVLTGTYAWYRSLSPWCKHHWLIGYFVAIGHNGAQLQDKNLLLIINDRIKDDRAVSQDDFRTVMMACSRIDVSANYLLLKNTLFFFLFNDSEYLEVGSIFIQHGPISWKAVTPCTVRKTVSEWFSFLCGISAPNLCKHVSGNIFMVL